MLNRAFVPFAAFVLATALVAQDKTDNSKAEAKPMAAPARMTAEGAVEHGKVKLVYGSPKWNDKLVANLEGGTIWRLGDNDASTISFDCGIKAANSVVLPGAYGVALRYVDKTTVSLVVYEGSSFHVEGLPTYEIPGTLKADAEVSKTLKISVDGAALKIAFGPYAATVPLMAVKAHAPVETDFANVTAKVVVLELDVSKGCKDLKVGSTSIEQDGVSTKYDMFLTMEADKAVLVLKNGDAKIVAKDKETVGGIIKQINAMKENAPAEGKTMLEAAVGHFEKQMKVLETKEMRVSRLQDEKSIEVKSMKREKAATKLAFSSERPEGAIVFKFGANDSDAEFRIVPSEFRKRRGA